MKEIKSYIPDIEGKCADIDGVIVLPEYRGNNLQNSLVNYLEKRAKKLNMPCWDMPATRLSPRCPTTSM